MKRELSVVDVRHGTRATRTGTGRERGAVSGPPGTPDPRWQEPRARAHTATPTPAPAVVVPQEEKPNKAPGKPPVHDGGKGRKGDPK